MTSQEKMFKINKVIWTAKSRVFYARISIPKHYRIIMSSMASIKLIQIIVIFRYYTKGVSNQVSSNSDYEIKSFSCSNSSIKVEKNDKVGKYFLSDKTGQ